MNATYESELYHFGVKGMKWGVRKDYRSTGIRGAIARRQNAKIDKSFKKWDQGAKNRDTAIELGKKRNAAKMAYESNKNKETKAAYKSAQKDYKKAYRKNTAYRKGTVRQEVGHDMSRKYLSAAKKVGKQLNQDPTNKDLQKQYNRLNTKHDIERAKARKAQAVGANRSNRIAALKRTGKMTLAAAGASGAIYAGKKYMAKKNITISIHDAEKAQKAARYVKAGADFIRNFMY